MGRSSPNSYGRIRRYILTSMILVPAVPFVLILAIGYFYFTNALTTSGMASVRRIVADHSHMIESFLLERKADLEFVQEAYLGLFQTERRSGGDLMAFMSEV